MNTLSFKRFTEEEIEVIREKLYSPENVEGAKKAFKTENPTRLQLGLHWVEKNAMEFRRTHPGCEDTQPSIS